MKHIRNKLSDVAYFLQRNIDMLISVHTPPTHSWKNPCERVMSFLNIGLQSVGMIRQETENYEHVMKSANSLAAIRAKGDPAIEDEVINCVQPTIKLLESIFSQLTLGEKNFQVFKAGAVDDLKVYLDGLKHIDEEFDPSIVLDSKKQIKNVPSKLKAFLEQHCG